MKMQIDIFLTKKKKNLVQIFQVKNLKNYLFYLLWFKRWVKEII